MPLQEAVILYKLVEVTYTDNPGLWCHGCSDPQNVRERTLGVFSSDTGLIDDVIRQRTEFYTAQGYDPRGLSKDVEGSDRMVQFVEFDKKRVYIDKNPLRIEEKEGRQWFEGFAIDDLVSP